MSFDTLLNMWSYCSKCYTSIPTKKFLAHTEKCSSNDETNRVIDKDVSPPPPNNRSINISSEKTFSNVHESRSSSSSSSNYASAMNHNSGQFNQQQRNEYNQQPQPSNATPVTENTRSVMKCVKCDLIFDQLGSFVKHREVHQLMNAVSSDFDVRKSSSHNKPQSSHHDRPVDRPNEDVRGRSRTHEHSEDTTASLNSEDNEFKRVPYQSTRSRSSHSSRRIHQKGSIKTGKYLCKECGTGFSREAKLQGHLKSHYEESPFGTSDSDDSSGSEFENSETSSETSCRSTSSLVRTFHTRIRNEDCQHKTTRSPPLRSNSTSSSLSSPMASRLDGQPRQFKRPSLAPITTKIGLLTAQPAKVRRLFSESRATNEEKNSPEKCTQCDETFYTTSELAEHLMLHNNKAKVLTKNFLKIGARVHTGTRVSTHSSPVGYRSNRNTGPIPCTQKTQGCQETFDSIKKLGDHLDSVHPGKLHICPELECRIPFATRKMFDKHVIEQHGNN